MKYLILNENKVINTTQEIKNISIELKKGVNNLKDAFYDLESGKVNYQAIKGSEIFENYKSITLSLINFDLNTLKTQDAKLAFWINIYNSLVVHGIVELQINKTIKEVSGFFEKVSYKIGEYVFSLDDIEHGILRQNKKKNFFSLRSFSSSDPRINFILEKLEPRIHFCLVCGSKSCPPIGTYQEEQIEKQLNLATSNFINGPDVVLEKERYTLKVSKIFKWYKNDFGGNIDLINFLQKYLKNKDTVDFLKDNSNKISISYLDYDWGLNH